MDRVEIPGLVSTIIPVRNRPRMIVSAIESVLSQTYDATEVIVSDDGSSDDTVAVAEGMASANPGRITVIRGPQRGAGGAREAGRLAARGEFIQYLDSDDLLLPRKFDLQVKALRARPECGAAYGYIRHVDADGKVMSEPFKDSGVVRETLFPTLLMSRWWNTDCPLFRRSVTDAVGPWSNLRYSQDWEYDGRVGALGTRLAHCPDWVCVQHSHAEARQTGHGGWLSPKDRIVFLRSLYRSSLLAGMTSQSSQMRSFARWVFYHARYAASAGDEASSKELLGLAREIAGRSTVDMLAFSALARLAGWSRAARWAESLRGRIVGGGQASGRRGQ